MVLEAHAALVRGMVQPPTTVSPFSRGQEGDFDARARKVRRHDDNPSQPTIAFVHVRGDVGCAMVEPVNIMPNSATIDKFNAQVLTPKFRFEHKIAPVLNECYWGKFRSHFGIETDRDRVAVCLYAKGPSGRGKTFAAHHEDANAVKNNALTSDNSTAADVVVASVTRGRHPHSTG
jgi:hypothetical protein